MQGAQAMTHHFNWPLFIALATMVVPVSMCTWCGI